MTIVVSPADDPATFARQVKAAAPGEVDELVAGGRRAEVLAGIFLRMPEVFRADRAGSLEAVVHWHVTGPPEGADDVFELRIADGHCVVAERPEQTPRLTLWLDAVNFVRMTTGNANARLLFMRGKLRARGDLGLVNKFPGLFDVPRP
jgi:SCP-2 sterol transfer family